VNMPLAEAFGAYLFGASLWIGVPATQRAYHLLKWKLQNDPAWKAGPNLSLDTVLADISYTNRLAKVLIYKGHRIRFSITWEGYSVGFLKVLRISRRLALRLGEVRVHCELIPEGMLSPTTPKPSPFSTRKPSSREKLPKGSGRRRYSANLLQFYSFLKPAIEQITIDAAYAEQKLPRPFSPTGTASMRRRIKLARSESLTNQTCCICMEDTVDIATDCGHAFCQECHDTWRNLNEHCPLCRADLPALDEDGFDTFQLVGADWSKLQITPRAPPTRNDFEELERSESLTRDLEAIAAQLQTEQDTHAASFKRSDELHNEIHDDASTGQGNIEDTTAIVPSDVDVTVELTDGGKDGTQVAVRDVGSSASHAGDEPCPNDYNDVDPLLDPIAQVDDTSEASASAIASPLKVPRRPNLKVTISEEVMTRKISNGSERDWDNEERQTESSSGLHCNVNSTGMERAGTPTTPRTPTTPNRGNAHNIPSHVVTLERVIEYVFALPVSNQ